MKVAIEQYLTRIGYEGSSDLNLETLAGLQLAHMTSVPFENLDVFYRTGVRTDLEWSLGKIVGRRRGGWCFEVNGAFAALLEAMGFPVRLLGAAVLLDGPNKMIDHLTLEVAVEGKAYLVDAGFGDSFAAPLLLSSREPQDAITGRFQFLASPEGTTLARLDEANVPVAQYRFKRVALKLSDFDAASNLLQSDEKRHWRNKPFATRLLAGGTPRVTLLKDRLRFVPPPSDGSPAEQPVSAHEWADVLHKWFALDIPGRAR